MKKVALLIKALLLVSTITSLKAEPGQMGSIGYLRNETRYLLNSVQTSGLNYNAKDTVYRFSSDVDRLAYCAQNTGYPGCPSQCRYYLDKARRSFSDVTYYLQGTYYSFPQVYNQWRRTDDALRSIYVNPGPGPQPQTVKCVAVDTGWEEHSGGHVAYGYNIYSAQNSALNQCRKYHGSCRISSCQ